MQQLRRRRRRKINKTIFCLTVPMRHIKTGRDIYVSSGESLGEEEEGNSACELHSTLRGVVLKMNRSKLFKASTQHSFLIISMPSSAFLFVQVQTKNFLRDT